MNFIKQKFSSLFTFRSTINQILNIKKNERIVSYFLEQEFEKINSYLERNQTREAEAILETIFLKKENLNDTDELKILEYKGLIALLKKEFNMIDVYIEEMKTFQGFESFRDMILLNMAIHKRDSDSINKLKDDWKSRNIDGIIIIQNEMNFWLHVQDHAKVIEIFKKNEDLIDRYEDILIIVGQSYIQLGLNDDAINILKNCNEENDSVKLWLEIANFKKAFKRHTTINEFKEKEDINGFITEFLNIKKENLSFHEQLNLVLVHARVTFFVDLNECKNLILELKKEYNITELDVLYLDVLEQSNKFREAEIIFEDLINSNEILDLNLVTRGVFIKYNLKKYYEVKELYEKYIKFAENTSEVTYYYGLSLIQVMGTNNAKEELEGKIIIEDEFSFLLLARLNIDIKESRELYLSKLKEIIDSSSYFNLCIADIYCEINNLTEAYNILIDGAESNKMFFKRLISILSKSNFNSKENKKLLEIFFCGYKGNLESYINEYIYILLVKNEKYIKAQALAKKMYEDKKNLYWANNYFEMKITNKDLDELESLITMLEVSMESKYIINAAIGNIKLGRYTMGKELAFKAYCRMKNSDETIFHKIGALSLEIEQVINHKNEEGIFEREFVVSLVGVDGEITKYIYINEKIALYNFNMEKDMKVGNFNDDIFIEVLDKRKNDKIIIEDKEFKISEKLNKYSYMFRQGISYLLYSEKNSMKKILLEKDGSGDLNIQYLIDELKIHEDKQKENIQMYLEGKIPLCFLYTDEEKLPIWIERLSVIEEYGILAGAMSNSIKVGDKIVLSLSSIFALYFKGLLEYYIENFDVIVGREVIKELHSSLDSLTKGLTVKSRTIFLVEGKLSIHEESLEYKKGIIKKYKKIIKILNSVKICEVNLLESEILVWGEGSIPTSDIECIEIAKKNKATVLMEDYMLSEVASLTSKEIRIDNIANITITMILNENNIVKNIDALKLLIKERYRFVFCSETIERFVFCFKLKDTWRSKKFKEIIELLLDYDFDRFYAMQLLELSNKVLEKNPTDVKGRIIRDSIWKKYLKLLMKDQLVINE